MIFEWGSVCGDQVDRFPYRLDFCVPKEPLDHFKKGGNGKCRPRVTHCFHSLMIFSMEHYDGLHLCIVPMVDHVETGHEEVGEDRPLCCHVSGMLPSLTPIPNAQDLTLAKGHGHRNRICDPNTLEISRKRQRRIVLLAPRHVRHLVLLRSCGYHHRAMRPSAAGACERRPFDASYFVKAATVHGGL